MKKGILFLAILVVLSCNNDDDNNGQLLTDTWKLTEILADPGDGSGTFQPFESDKTLTFYSNGTVASNDAICTVAANTGTPSTGIYNANNEIIGDDCEDSPLMFEYENETLIIHYLCIEQCSEKYVRLN